LRSALLRRLLSRGGLPFHSCGGLGLSH
jgi:hypothetical protein